IPHQRPGERAPKEPMRSQTCIRSRWNSTASSTPEFRAPLPTSQIKILVVCHSSSNLHTQLATWRRPPRCAIVAAEALGRSSSLARSASPGARRLRRREEIPVADQPDNIPASFAQLQSAFQPEKAAGVNRTLQFDYTGREAGIWNLTVSNGTLQYGEGPADS